MAIFDNHIHLRASFKGVEAAKAFEKAGGTAILLTHSPYAEVPITRAGDYEKAYGLTLAMADAVRAATHLQVFVALGPYPVEFIDLRETLGQEAAMDAMKRAIDLAATHIRERRAVAFGEIGRPHFPVDAEIVRACNEIVVYAMAQARSLECAVVLHTEDPTPTTFAEFAAMAARAGLDPKYIVKHHSTPFTRREDTSELVPSILAKEELVAGSERRPSIPPGNRLHRRSAPARGRLRTRDGAEEDQGLARERVAHNRAGFVDPPRLARKDLPYRNQLIATCQFVSIKFRPSR